MRLHIVSETEYFIKGNGVHSAFIDHVDLMKETNDIEVVINNEGHGDIFHCHTYGLFYFLKGFRYKGRRVYTVHVIPDSIIGSLPFWKLLMPFVKWYLMKVYSFADVCIAISPHVKEAILKSGAKTEIARICNPISTEKWKSSQDLRKEGRAFLGIGDEEFVVLGVGQLQSRKGVEDFIDIAKYVPEARFVWVGGRPFKFMTEGIDRINSKINSATPNVTFIGMIDLDRMSIVYNAADMLLFPSYQENCPMAPIEAASCGLPVIYRNLEEYKALYEHIYIKANDTNDFIKKTRLLMNDHNYYLEAVLISANLIKQFDKNTIREKLLTIYQRLK